VLVDDVKCFDQFCNLKTFVLSAQNDDFKTVSVMGGLNTFRRAVMQTAIRVA
jgi:hypothetical protein